MQKNNFFVALCLLALRPYHFRTSARAASQKGIKDNNVFQKFDRTIKTKVTCGTKVENMYRW
jgi:hypothetical protein